MLFRSILSARVGPIVNNRATVTVTHTSSGHADTMIRLYLNSKRWGSSDLASGSWQLVDLPVGTVFSVIGVTGLDGLTIDGARWPLTNCDVPLGSTLTLSNVATGAVSLSLRGGKAVMFSHFRTEL